MAVKIVTDNGGGRQPVIERFLARPAFSAEAERVAAGALAEIGAEGAAAVCRYVERFDHVRLKPKALRVDDATVAQALREVSPRHRRALRAAHARVVEFARAGLRQNWRMPTAGGGYLGEKYHPFDRVGVYIPGGEAPLVSTVIMTVTLARVAGVREIVACTPCGPDGRVNPMILSALRLAGATEIYRVGGIAAIGMMAYGIAGVKPVQKIVGPGGPYVTAAKRQVYGRVALDLVAGPSEIAILADATAKPAHVAADLLSQAEHGTGWEKALLVTTSAKLARAVAGELEAQAATLPRASAIRKVMQDGMLLVVVRTLREGMTLCNRFAPEHFELLVRHPRDWVARATHAGAVFVGPWTPESAGDFAAGPSHVLPTGGAAAMFSGLTVDDFRRRSSVVELTESDLRDVMPIIEAFGEMEGLEAHARSARLRFQAS